MTGEQQLLQPEQATIYDMQIKNLEEQLQQAKEQLKEAQKREEWQRQHIEAITNTIKQLEAPKKIGLFSRWFS